jgi:hypothetical protein
MGLGLMSWISGFSIFAVILLDGEEAQATKKAANLMTKDEARRIAPNIVKLPGLLGKDAPR